ncbi:ion channel [Jiulongibacter sediminis]|uniref:Potassium transporter n=1 Tax=Jiulongibacter sediminis TaxID=1605367 RepID=A0A0P7C741_9BACT|nr:ion channel [Jiulongibacter sediminis]KPM49278.1 potassium transporter [Jiulongibacter sediminis]TBX26333.1 potassium transporter [Jiulongibacter sediminis]
MASKNNNVEQERSREDSGFGTRATSTTARLIRSDGSFNVRKLNQSFESQLNIYHRLINMHWIRFGLFILLFYFLLNLLFAAIYYYIGVEHLEGISTNHGMNAFWEAFFFSSQTLTTVGYGKISPEGYLTSFVAALEALIGLMTFAIMTGLLYGRFSKPNPRIRYSERALIAPYLDITGFMFRMANEKTNQLMDVEVNIIFTRNEEVKGEIKRKYYTLPLERNKIKYMATDWTVVHPITTDSILFNETPESLEASDGEFMISVQATNDTMSDPVHSQKSYMYNELVWGAKFVPLLEAVNGEYRIDLSKVGKFELSSLT